MRTLGVRARATCSDAQQVVRQVYVLRSMSISYIRVYKHSYVYVVVYCGTRIVHTPPRALTITSELGLFCRVASAAGRLVLECAAKAAICHVTRPLCARRASVEVM
jgi:hypothetical protein